MKHQKQITQHDDNIREYYVPPDDTSYTIFFIAFSSLIIMLIRMYVPHIEEIPILAYIMKIDLDSLIFMTILMFIFAVCTKLFSNYENSHYKYLINKSEKTITLTRKYCFRKKVDIKKFNFEDIQKISIGAFYYKLAIKKHLLIIDFEPKHYKVKECHCILASIKPDKNEITKITNDFCNFINYPEDKIIDATRQK